jgi:hypothetical protein
MMARKIAVVVAAATCMLTTLSPAGAAASTKGSEVFSADQVGYSATGARFYGVGIWAKLPDASHFSGQLGSVGVSVQLWTRHLVFDLTVSACTDRACSPGGKPETRRYRPVLSIFNRSTHALVCSTSAATVARRCPGVMSDWTRCRISPKQTASLSLNYFHPAGWLILIVQGGRCDANFIYAPGVGLVVDQARIVAQFGGTPWSASRVRAPKSAERVITLGVPPPPPYSAEVGIYTTQFYGACIGSRWVHHAIAMTGHGTRSGKPQAIPTAIWGDGCDFGIDLEPR